MGYEETPDCNEAMSPTQELAVDTFTVTGQETFTMDCCEVTCNSYLVSTGSDDFHFVGAFPPLRPLPLGISLVTSFVRLGQRFTPLYEETSLRSSTSLLCKKKQASEVARSAVLQQLYESITQQTCTVGSLHHMPCLHFSWALSIGDSSWT